MLAPAYKLTVGNRVVDTSDEPRASTLTALSVTLDHEPAADVAVLVLGNVGGLAPERGDEATIELGYLDGELTTVWSGTVDRVERNLQTTRVTLANGAQTLLRRYLEQTYEAKSAGEIVRDLAERAAVQVAQVEEGIRFPAYVIDGQSSFYRHMANLAALSGFDLYHNERDQLVFKPFNGGNRIHILEYAKHLLRAGSLEKTPVAGKVTAWGESPGGGQGEEAWAWLSKDFSASKGEAGTGELQELLEIPALRDGEAAATAARARAAVHRRGGLTGRIRVLGLPAVKLGDAVRLRQAPGQVLNDTFQVRAVHHHLDKRGGFYTTIDFRSL